MSPLPRVTLEGRFVRLMPLELEHIEPLLAITRGRRDKFPYALAPDDEPGMRKYVEDALRSWEQGQALPWVCVDPRDGKVVGTTRLAGAEYWEWPAGHPRLAEPRCPDSLEPWTWLSPDLWPIPVFAEAKLMTMTHAFETLGVQRVIIMWDSRNEQVRQYQLQVGVHIDGVLRATRMSSADAVVCDNGVATILAPEWPALKEKLRAELDDGDGDDV